MIPEERAIEIVLSAVERLESVEIGLNEAVGRVLAEGVDSDIDMPPFPKAAMDGFALRATDVEGTPTRLRVVGEIPAGVFPEFSIGPGEAAKIMTGAPVPNGADSVQMVEKTSGFGHTEIEIFERVVPGEHVCRKGEDMTAGQEVLRAGRVLSPAEIGILASVGKERVRVHRSPEVAILVTGDELVARGVRPEQGQIRDSNGPMVAALVRGASGRVREAGIVSDRGNALERAVEEGLTADVMLLTGGVSAGEYDRVADVLRSAGVEILFHRVAIKPGKPLLFGRRGSTLVFGLPGNPVSVLVTFRLFVEPAIRKMRGLTPDGEWRFQARLVREIRKKPDRTWYLPARVRFEDSEILAEVLETHGSADLGGFAMGGALVVAPLGTTRIPAGSRVAVRMGGGSAG